MPPQPSAAPITRTDLREELRDFRKELRLDFATKHNLDQMSEDIIKEVDAKASVILEAVGELHGDRIRHAQEAIIELAKRVDAADLDVIRKVQADLG